MSGSKIWCLSLISAVFCLSLQLLRCFIKKKEKKAYCTVEKVRVNNDSITTLSQIFNEKGDTFCLL